MHYYTSLQYECKMNFIFQIYCPIICPVKGKIYTTTQHPCSESALKNLLEDANFEYTKVSQTKRPMLEKGSSTMVSHQ